MLVLNCPKDFHDKYYPFSTNQVIQGIPYLKKKESLFEEDFIKNENNEIIKGEIKGTLQNNKKDSEQNDDNKNNINKKKVIFIEIMKVLLQKMKMKKLILLNQ